MEKVWMRLKLNIGFCGFSKFKKISPSLEMILACETI